METIFLQPDGKILIGGRFDTYNGASRVAIARLNSDGSLDTSFNSPFVDADISAIAVQPDGKILVAGGIDLYYNSVDHYDVARLNADGTVDTSFNSAGEGVGQGSARALAFYRAGILKGKILIAGRFALYNGITRNNVARLNFDGSLDTSFDPGTGPDISVTTMAIQANDKVVIGGVFNSVAGYPRHRAARLNPNGTLDTTFDPQTPDSVVDGVNAIAVQPDGKLLFGGDITAWGSSEIPDYAIVRTNPDGTLDPSFLIDANNVFNNGIYAMALQPDGRILVAGAFQSIGGVSREHVARLNNDGTLDLRFDPGTGTDNLIYAMIRQPDGKVLIGSDFNTYDGTTRYGVVRINGYGKYVFLPMVIRH